MTSIIGRIWDQEIKITSSKSWRRLSFYTPLTNSYASSIKKKHLKIVKKITLEGKDSQEIIKKNAYFAKNILIRKTTYALIKNLICW